MVLCRYFNEYGLENVLCNLRIKVTDPVTINDPFEFAPYIDKKERINDRKVRKYFRDKYDFQRLYKIVQLIGVEMREVEFEKYMDGEMRGVWNHDKLLNMLKAQRRQQSKEHRILSLTQSDKVSPEQEILMWSHYADKHQGLRIHFDLKKIGIDSPGPDPIKYRSARLKVSKTKLITRDKVELDKIVQSMLDKSHIWKYEHEYRWLINIDECFSLSFLGKTIEFIAIKPEAIVRVDIGVNSPEVFKDNIIRVLRNEYFKHVEVYIAKLDDKRYKLDYQKV